MTAFSSEFRYFNDITTELLHDKLCPAIDNLCRASGESEQVELLLSRCEHLIGRVSRAISKTEGELLSEWLAIQKLSVEEVEQRDNAVLLHSELEQFPHRLIAVVELKFKLLQCSTSLRGRTPIPSFGAADVFEEEHPDFLARCHGASQAALSELLSTRNHHAALSLFTKTLGAVESDINLTTFASLLTETLKIVLGHVDIAKHHHRRETSTTSSSSAHSPVAPSAAAPQPPQLLPLSSSSSSSATTTTQLQQPQQPPKPLELCGSSSLNASSLVSANGSARPSTAATTALPSPATDSLSGSNYQKPAQLQQYDPATMTEAHIKDALSAFYSDFAPDYVASVPYLVQEYRNNYQALIEMVASKYGAVIVDRNGVPVVGGGGGGSGGGVGEASSASTSSAAVVTAVTHQQQQPMQVQVVSVPPVAQSHQQPVTAGGEVQEGPASPATVAMRERGDGTAGEGGTCTVQ